MSLQGHSPHRTLARALLFSLVGVRGIVCLTGSSDPLAHPSSSTSLDPTLYVVPFSHLLLWEGQQDDSPKTGGTNAPHVTPDFWQ